jgi:hypothetical protein
LYKSKSKILNSIYGALFFDVPSQGMENLEIITMAERQPNEDLMRLLSKDSQLLRSQHEDFCSAFDSKDSQIVYFYGTKKSATAKKVSARLGFQITTRYMADRSRRMAKDGV